MAQYLRDEQLENVTIDRDVLSRLIDALYAQMISMPEYLQGQQNQNLQALDAMLVMTIRFDGKGYRVFSKDILLNYFEAATHVERIVFELSSLKAIQTGKTIGSYLDLRMDANEASPSHLVSTSDNENWMNASFGAVKEILTPCKNKNHLAKSPLIELALQLFGVFACFLFSAWAATLISPSLNIENPFLMSFVLILLVVSNLWGFMNLRLKASVARFFPRVSFYRPQKNRLHWLMQAVVGGLMAALVLYLLGLAFTYTGKLLGIFVGSA